MSEEQSLASAREAIRAAHEQSVRLAEQAASPESKKRAALAMSTLAQRSEGQTAAESNDAVHDEEFERVRQSASGDEPGRVKLTVKLPERDMATLRSIAAKRDMTLTDVVRRAIAMEQFIEEVQSQGGKLLVEQPDHSMRQLVLR
jgi:hypothetical protein